MHTHHPDVHEYGLADGCPGCDEVAANPFANADRDLLRQLVELAVAVPRRIPDGDAQAIAVKNVLDALERTGRLAQDAPGPLEGYLRERWRVRCRIEGGA